MAMLDLVIPDTGPLITLALIDRLDLLDRFRCPILVTDMIHAELTRGPDTAPDKTAIERWYRARGNRVQTVDTLYGTMWRELPEETRRSIKRQFPNAGEESIREFAGRVAEVLPEGDQILVLFEEEKVKRMSFGRHVHLLHTWAFMVALERMGVIPSADDLYKQVEQRGRTIARDVYERRASAGGGYAQDWTEDYDRQAGI
ncbi:hypothetical protein MKK67_14000 [Methylobacterium sp. J-072]|uniref:hypothetical protein n=1 Tax=Methylobacterium sp. J-072 TaxID=2836651 RepID=UPI001FBBA085|nr:hypothetical protein [Methylobacterium sp. J-072]MCJ2093592.1 hypothetical protein [Methylobacterium sp. J-072]